MNIRDITGSICIWGDSISWGAYDLEKGGWINRLRLFAENETEEYFEIYNLGVAGDNTDDLLLRFEVECKARETKVIVFAIGINDSQYINDKSNPRVSLQKFRENMQLLIDTAKKYTEKIIVIGLTKIDDSKTMPIPWNTEKYYDNDNIKRYDLELKNVAEKNELSYLRMFDLLEPDDIEDGLHPNSKGHEKIFNYIKMALFEKNS